MRNWNCALVRKWLIGSPSRQRVIWHNLVDQKNGDRMIKQLLNSVIAKYRDLSVSRRSFICLSLGFRQIIDLRDTNKSWYFAQHRSINVISIYQISGWQFSRVLIGSRNLEYPGLVFTKSVDSNFRAFWLAPVTRNILGYSLFCERKEKWRVVSLKF